MTQHDDVQARYDDDEEDDGPSADPQLEGGMPLPIRLAAEFPPELTAIPLEDIDPYYQNKKVSIHIFSSSVIFFQPKNKSVLNDFERFETHLNRS